jgi:hypothetical protein
MVTAELRDSARLTKPACWPITTSAMWTSAGTRTAPVLARMLKALLEFLPAVAKSAG